MQKIKSFAFVVGLAIVFALIVIYWYEFLKIHG